MSRSWQIGGFGNCHPSPPLETPQKEAHTCKKIPTGLSWLLSHAWFGPKLVPLLLSQISIYLPKRSGSQTALLPSNHWASWACGSCHFDHNLPWLGLAKLAHVRKSKTMWWAKSLIHSLTGNMCNSFEKELPMHIAHAHATLAVDCFLAIVLLTACWSHKVSSECILQNSISFSMHVLPLSFY